MRYRIENSLSVRSEDGNGYIHIEKSPILRTGVLEYLGSEILPDGEDNIDGVKIEPDKIYKVYISDKELKKGANSFKLLPITDEHQWLGSEGEDAKEYQQGTIGDNVYVEDGKLYADLMFTGKGIIDDLKDGKEELSSSYINKLRKADNADYDFIAEDIKGNHLALVDKGRCGSDVRVLNSNTGVYNMAKAKVANKAILKLDDKEIDLDPYFEDKSEENGDADKKETIAENEDKREIIRKIMAVAGKSDDDFDGGEDEKIRTVAELAEQLAYNPSEDSKTDNEEEVEEKDEEEEKVVNIDKRDIIRQIMAIAGKEEASEDVKTIAKLAEKLAYEPSEESESDNACRTQNADMLANKIARAIKAENKKVEAGKVKAYNSARAVIGDFNPFGLSEKDMYVKALNHLGVDLDGNEKVSELSAMLKACANISKVDNSFAYDVSGKEEKEFNI